MHAYSCEQLYVFGFRFFNSTSKNYFIKVIIYIIKYTKSTYTFTQS